MEPVYFIARGKQKAGPFRLSQLGALAASGQLRPGDMVLPEGAGKWVAASSIEGVFPAVPTAIPVAPVPAAAEGPRGQGRPARKRLWIGAGAIGLAACAGILFFIFLKGDPVADARALAAEDLREVERLLRSGKGSGPYLALQAPRRLEAWRQAAESGSPEGQLLLARCYGIGAGVDRDPQQMMTWLRRSAEQGFAPAQSDLGSCYCTGEGVARDAAEGVRWLRLAADQGNVIAQGDLAGLYWSGQGVARDREESIRYWRLAADQGLLSAQVQLGICYAAGDVVPRDPVEAVRWFRQAAEQEDPRALTCLGVCHASGEGVPPDWAKAVELYERAARAGNTAAMNNLGQCYEHGRGVAKDPATAAEWYEKAAQAGDLMAMYRIGLCYREGTGVPRDPERARQWLDRSGRAGDVPTSQAVASLSLPEKTPAPEATFFNGRDLTGWQGLPGYWQVSDGTLVGAPPEGQKAHTFLCSTQTYRDFELRFKVRRKNGIGNSGVQFRSRLLDPARFRVVGPQLEIEAASFSIPPGSVITEPTGSPSVRARADVIARVWKDADFNDMILRCVGQHVTVTVNGTVVVDDEFPSMPDEGIIAWQLHGGSRTVQAPQEMAFKDIQLTNLGGDLLAKGSVWRGTSHQVRPAPASPQQIDLIVTGRYGPKFTGRMLHNGRHLRNIEGYVADGTIRWSGAPGEQNRGHYNVGTLNGKRIEVKYFRSEDSPEEDGTLTLSHVARGPAGHQPRSDEAHVRQMIAVGLFFYALGAIGGGGWDDGGGDDSQWNDHRRTMEFERRRHQRAWYWQHRRESGDTSVPEMWTRPETAP